jgi:choline transport protein
LAWQAAAATLNYIAASLIQGLIVLWHTEYEPQAWHLTLIMIGVGMLTLMVSTFGSRILPIFELLILFLHFFGILIILIPLWVLAPKVTGREVFLNFEDFGIWGNTGLACLIAQIAPFFALSRVDSGTQICKLSSGPIDYADVWQPTRFLKHQGSYHVP